MEETKERRMNGAAILAWTGDAHDAPSDRERLYACYAMLPKTMQFHLSLFLSWFIGYHYHNLCCARTFKWGSLPERARKKFEICARTDRRI